MGIFYSEYFGCGGMDIGDFIIAFHKWDVECEVTQTNSCAPVQEQLQQNSEMMSASLHQSQLSTFCYLGEADWPTEPYFAALPLSLVKQRNCTG